MSLPFAQVDPFTQAFRALWAQLEAEQAFARLVPKGNRIKFDGADRSPEKRQTATADFPEVRIVAAGGEADLVRCSDDTQVIQTLQIQMSSGDNRFTAVYLPLKWACIRALANTKDNPLNFGLDFITDVTIAAVNDSDSDLEGRAQGAWSGLLDVAIDMTFNTQTDLQTAIAA